MDTNKNKSQANVMNALKMKLKRDSLAKLDFNSIPRRMSFLLFMVIIIEGAFFMCLINFFDIFSAIDRIAASNETLPPMGISTSLRESLYMVMALSSAAAIGTALLITKFFICPLEKTLTAGKKVDPVNSAVLEKANMAIFEWQEKSNQVYITKHLFPLLGEPDPELHITGYIPANVFKAKITRFEKHLARDYCSENSKVFHVDNGGNMSKWLKLSLIKEDNRNIGLIEDITEEMLKKNKMEFERDYDVLTSLLNRRAFNESMQTLFSTPDKLGTAAMIYMDLDNLKFINDSYGHDYGDQYIRTLASILNTTCKGNVVISRLGGDEFALFLFGYSSKEDIGTEIIRLNIAIKNQTFRLPGDMTTNLSASMGISWYPSDSTSPNQLLEYADFAMYSAKKAVKGSFAEFQLRDYNQEAYLSGVSLHLEEFIKNKMFEYTFQPIVSAQTGNICAYEAFIKSKHPAIKNPKQLFALAKSRVDFYELERLTWNEALSAFDELCAMPAIKLFINSISDQRLTVDDQKLLERNYCHLLNQVVVDVNDAGRANFDCTKSKLDFLKNWGGQIAVSDYGTGTYNQDSLVSLSPKYLKLNISLTQNLYRDPIRLQLVESIISFAHQRNIKIIAEGIEKPEDMFTLIDIGADYLQGYHICKPLAQPPKLLAITTAQITNYNNRKAALPLAKEA